MIKNIPDSKWTVSNIFGPILIHLFLKIFTKNALTQSIFELEKCSFFRWVRILPEIDWYHYQSASLAPTCLVQHQTLIKTPMSYVSHQNQVCPPPTHTGF